MLTMFDFQDTPIIKTEVVKYDPTNYSSSVLPPPSSPFVVTETRTVGNATDIDTALSDAKSETDVVETNLISTQNITSKTRTVETVTVSRL